MDFLPQNITEYCQKISNNDKLLEDLERETTYKILMPRMLCGKVMGNFLRLISIMKNPKYILEIGTYTGYSAICLAQGLSKNGLLHTIEINEELQEISQKYFKKADLEDKIKLHIGNAKDIIPKFNVKFDLIFIDADKKNYDLYYELALKKINKRGYILIDNVLWSGKVLEEIKQNDIETYEIEKLNTKIMKDQRVHNTLLPIRDGIMICQVL